MTHASTPTPARPISDTTIWPSSQPGHEAYLLVLFEDCGGSCSCLDWFKKTWMEGQVNYVCKHLEAWFRQIVARQQGVAVANSAVVPGRDRPRPGTEVATRPDNVVDLKSKRGIPFA